MVSVGTRHIVMALSLGILGYVYREFLVSPPPTPVIRISSGDIQGKIEKARDSSEFFSFQGIPYAKPPVGELRFESPVQIEPWTGVKMTQKLSSECMQLEIMASARTIGNEDCLYLNVYVPSPSNRRFSELALVPVMVYIHGGYFMAGSANMYKPKYFMSQSDTNVILVTLNYRLAALGFFNTGDGTVKGNMGLKDQNLALKWVQTNIRAFGGDPDKVTIFGESAGAGSVHHHILSPMSKGLFSQAITQSGSAISPWALNKDVKTQSKWLGQYFNCPTDDTKKMVACLKKIDPKTFVQIHISFMSVLKKSYEQFIPSIEVEKGPNAFITEKPEDILKSGNFNQVPLITGVNSHEGLMTVGKLLANTTIANNLDKEWTNWAPIMLAYDSHKNKNEISSKIRKFYFGDKIINPKKDVDLLARLFSDRLFFISSYKAAVGHSAANNSVYFYYFTYPPQVSLFRVFKAVTPGPGAILPMEIHIAADVAKDMFSWVLGNPSKSLGPCHGDELPLLFNMHFLAEITQGSRDYEMSQRFINLWTSFAHNKMNRLKSGETNWTPIDVKKSKFQVLQLDLKGGMIDSIFEDSVEFWGSLGV